VPTPKFLPMYLLYLLNLELYLGPVRADNSGGHLSLLRLLDGAQLTVGRDVLLLRDHSLPVKLAHRHLTVTNCTGGE